MAYSSLFAINETTADEKGSSREAGININFWKLREEHH